MDTEYTKKYLWCLDFKHKFCWKFKGYNMKGYAVCYFFCIMCMYMYSWSWIVNVQQIHGSNKNVDNLWIIFQIVEFCSIFRSSSSELTVFLLQIFVKNFLCNQVSFDDRLKVSSGFQPFFVNAIAASRALESWGWSKDVSWELIRVHYWCLIFFRSNGPLELAL